MNDIMNSLGLIILTFRKNIKLYEVKCQRPEHNGINKPVQGTLKVLIKEKTYSFKHQIQNLDHLINEVISNKNLSLPKGDNVDVISKIHLCIAQDINISDELLQRFDAMNNKLKSLSDELHSDIINFMKL